MKKVYLSLCFCSFIFALRAQVAINKNNANPDASAMLDISSSDKGLLIPRLDSTARQNIVSPADGLMVYDTSTVTFWYYDNNKWNEIRNGSEPISYLDIVEELPEENLDLSCTTEVEEVVESFGVSAAVVSGHYLYGVANGLSSSNFRIIDISDPTDFELIAEIEVPGNPTELVVVGQYAYLVHNNGTEELSVIDISDSNNPTVGTTLNFGLGEKEIAAAGDYLYVIDNSVDLYFLDISNPSVPSIVNSIRVGLQPDDLATDGDYAYVLGEEELRVVDVSSVSNPSLIDTLLLGNSTRNIITDNAYAYVSDFTGEEIFIVDITAPSNLSITNTISLADRPREIAVANNYVFATGISGTFEIIDVSEPLHANIEATLSVLSAANSLNIAGSNAILTGGAGFNVIPITPCDPSYLAINAFSGELYAVEDTTVFVSRNGITTSLNNEDNFVFGADSLNYGSGTERKFFFDKSKGAFRAGEISNDNWNTDSLGVASFAAGTDTKATSIAATALGEKTSASGLAATAMGTETTASALAATAMGEKTTASGLASTAFGTETSASGTYATAFGEQTKAEDLAATAFGSFTVASGNFATAFGLETEASGSYATVFGQSTTASGDHTTAFGGFTMASGDYATAFGRSTTAPSYGEVVMGINNTTYAPNSTTGFNSSDRLFILGNGVAASHPSDALIIYKNGNTELNGALTIDGNYTFPTTDGTSGEVLSTDGNGNVSWTADNNTDDQALSFSGTTLSITDGNSVNLSSLVPVGTIQMWPTSSPPTGWLICNGSSFSSSTYPDLANVLGGTTLPNFNGRFPLGVGNSGTSGSTTHNIGSNGGAEKHTLSINEMPNHSHGAGSLSTSEPYLSQNGSGDQDKRDGGGTKLFEYSSITGNTSSAGGGQAHNNMPPFYVIHFIIRAE